MAVMSPGEFKLATMMQRFPMEPLPVFEDPREQISVWGGAWGCNSDWGTLRKVLMHRPGAEIATVDTAKPLDIGGFGDPETGWYWMGQVPPDLVAMQAQHDGFASALREEGVEVHYLDTPRPHLMKSIYTRDAMIAVPGGAIICRLGPRVRRGEELEVTRALARLGMPILRTLHADAVMEGGSFVWLNATTAAIGLSCRGNEAAATQIEEVLRPMGVRLLRVQCPGYRLHLDGGIVMCGQDAAIINQNLLPFSFIEEVRALGIRLVELQAEDPTDAGNCLAIAPDRVIMSAGITDATCEAVERLGIGVRRLDYRKVWAGGGGLHCSTAPLLRDRV